MIEFIICIFFTIVLSVILLFCYTVIHAQNTVGRRNQSNELREALDNIRVLESEFVRKIKELDELREKLQGSNVTAVDRQTLDISLASAKAQDDSDYVSDPPSPGIMVTDTENLYETSPYSEATIKNNLQDIAAARRRSSATSCGSSRHSSNASIQAISMHMLSGRGSIQETRDHIQLELGKEGDFWESTRRRSSTRSQSSSRRGSLMSGDTDELLPPGADIRRVSWPRVSGARRRHSTFPPENMGKIQEIEYQ